MTLGIDTVISSLGSLDSNPPAHTQEVTWPSQFSTIDFEPFPNPKELTRCKRKMQNIVDDIMALSGTLHGIDKDPLFTSKQHIFDRILGHLLKDTSSRHVRTNAQLKVWVVVWLSLYRTCLYLHMMALPGYSPRYTTVAFLRDAYSLTMRCDP